MNGSESIKLSELFSNLIDELKRIKVNSSNHETALFLHGRNMHWKNKAIAQGKKYPLYKRNTYNITKPSNINKNKEKCSHCNKKGHNINKCWIKNPYLKPNSNKNGNKDASSNSENSDKMEVEHAMIMTPKTDLDVASENEDFIFYSSSPNISPKTFVLDSGATSHVYCDKSLFIDLIPIEKYVSWGKINKIKASGIGSVPILFKDSNRIAILNNCLYIPKFEVNLISIGNLINRNFKVIFKNNCCKVYKNNLLITNSTTYKGLYLPPIISNKIELKEEHLFATIDNITINSDKNIKLWHERLGHISPSALQKLKLITNSNYDLNCQNCKLARLKQVINYNLSFDKATDYLYLVNLDLFGPVQTPSIGGSKYFITFLDKYSKFLVVYPL